VIGLVEPTPPVIDACGSLLLDAAIAEFLTALRAGKPSPHTIRGYASDLAVVRGLLAEDPATLTIEDLGVARLRAGFAAFADTHARASVLRAWQSGSSCSRTSSRAG